MGVLSTYTVGDTNENSTCYSPMSTGIEIYWMPIFSKLGHYCMPVHTSGRLGVRPFARDRVHFHGVGPVGTARKVFKQRPFLEHKLAR